MTLRIVAMTWLFLAVAFWASHYLFDAGDVNGFRFALVMFAVYDVGARLELRRTSP